MDGYEESREMIEPLLNAVGQVNGDTTHFVMYFGKCPRENLWNAEGYTSHAEGRAMEDNASWRGLQVIDSAVPPSNINYGNGLNGIVINARPVCIRTDGHCLGYRSDEVARNKAFVERIGEYLAELEVQTLLLNVGGSGCNTFFTHLDTCLFTSVGDISPHMCSTTAWLWMSYNSPQHQLRRVSQKLIHTCRCIEEFKTKFLAPRGVDVSLPSLFEIASNSDVTAFVGNSRSGVDVQKAEARQHEQCSDAGKKGMDAAGESLNDGKPCETRSQSARLMQMEGGKSVKGGVACKDNSEAARLLGEASAQSRADDLEKRFLDGDSDIHKVKCTQPIEVPVELPDGYTQKDFLTGDQTWICPYPDCMVKRGAGRGNPKIFDSSSSVSARKEHISTCRKKYEEEKGQRECCGFERLARKVYNSNHGDEGGFNAICPRCQEAGEHRPARRHYRWDSIMDGSSNVWKLEHIFSVEELNDLERQMCDHAADGEVNCGNAASSKWVKEGEEPWCCCVDCQEA